MTPRAPWNERLFEERPTASSKPCAECARTMWLPLSKMEERRFCDAKCEALTDARAVAARQKPCETCGTAITPKPRATARGHGRFCSQKCNTAGRAALNTPEAKARAQAGSRRARAEGRYPDVSGANNSRWMGGPKALLQRQIADGRAASFTRAYRKANPDKVREFSRRRAGRKMDRLPYGTLPRIRAVQKDRCAICRAAMQGSGHWDHIVPLAKGGKHVGANLQLLCGPCNLAKSDRDPIVHMRSLGRLL